MHSFTQPILGGLTEFASGVAIDSSGNAYVTGATGSTDFPTINSFQSAHMGGDSGDVYVTKINSNGSAYLYSTYLGGSDNEEGGGIAIDSVRNAYVTGRTDSTDFPTLNALQNNNHGNSDVFLSKFSPSGKKLVYSTYLGGSSVDIGSALAVDSAGSVYLLGSTISPDFPTLNAFQSENRLWDLFITKVKPDGQSLSYSTYLGGSLNDSADDLGFSTAAIAIDALGSAYVTGTTQSSDFPLVNALPQFAGIAIAGANASDFSQTNSCGTSIAAGAGCTISVQFAPSVIGARNAVVKVTAFGGGSPQSAALTGTGI